MPTLSENLAALASRIGQDMKDRVKGDRTISAGTGLTGGGSLAANRTIALSSTSISSLGKADTAVQPGSLATVATSGAYNDLSGRPVAGQFVPSGGAAGQILVKASATNYDTQWSTSAAATAVSYAPQTLSPSEQAQSRENIGVGTHVANVAALKALDPTKDTLVYLKEPGREGQFIWRSGDYSAQVAADTAEGVYIEADDTAATAGAWVRQYEGSASVGWFGAKGDGTTDDTQAFVAAYAVVNDVSVGEGIWIITGPITKRGVRGPRLIGNGPSETILDFIGDNAKISFAGVGTQVKGIHFRPRTAAIPICLEIGGVDAEYGGSLGSEISGNIFGYRSSGAYFLEPIRTVNLWYGVITQNKFGTEGAGGTICISAFFSVNVVVSDNTAENIGTFVKWQPDAYPEGGNNCEGWIIDGNAGAAMWSFFEADNGLLPLVSNNIIDIIYGFAIASFAGSGIFSNNWIAAAGGNDSSLIVSGGESSNINNNRIQSNSSVPNVIELKASEQIVTGNYVHGGVRAVADTSVGLTALSITGNVFKAQALEAANISASNSVYMGNIEIGTVADTTAGVRRDRREIVVQDTVTANGIDTLVVFDFPIPSGVFTAVPSFASISALNSFDVISGAYAPSESTPTSLRFRMSKVGGGPMPAAVAVSLFARE